ncbi:extracellular solute-binding protein [Amnibacterium sp. CER49]|uniref:extracellular solute-binding protein n=1 Tax=Amnibacterium sp. CER49 TaxID=3039161 RepID=UPI00244C2156|nr:extracellular solute-binding protein [Amnibacterium sp. CER49]MDH2442566.1 extracellular solute-binding protein [Amnibacterium sp. CER49]
MPKSTLAEFTKATGIKLHMQNPSYDVIHDKIVTAGAANTAFADVVYLDPAWIGQVGAAGWFEPLEKWVPSSTIKNDLGQSLFAYKGQTIGLPWNLDFRGTLWNMTLLKKAGINKPPTSYDELITTAEKLKSKGVVKYPVAEPLSITEGAATPWYALVRASGNAVLKNGKPAFQAGGAGAKALDLIRTLFSKQLIDPGSVNLTDQQVGQAFGNGDSAVMLSGGPAGLGYYAQPSNSKISSDQVTFTTLPTPDGSPSAGSVGLEDGMGIPKASTHKEAAALFVNWYLQEHQLNAAYAAAGLLPPNAAALKTLVSQGKLAGGQPLVDAAMGIKPIFEGGSPTWYSKFSSNVASMVQSVAVGSKSSGQGVAGLVSQVNALNAQQ